MFKQVQKPESYKEQLGIVRPDLEDLTRRMTCGWGKATHPAGFRHEEGDGLLPLLPFRREKVGMRETRPYSANNPPVPSSQVALDLWLLGDTERTCDSPGDYCTSIENLLPPSPTRTRARVLERRFPPGESRT